MRLVTRVTLPDAYPWRNSPQQEKAMLMTLSNRIDGSSDISPAGYAVLLIALFALAWLIAG